MTSDRFPEAFNRFENQRDISACKNYMELRAEFADWAGDKWVGSSRQNSALEDEAKKRGIKDVITIKRWLIVRRGIFIRVYRDSQGRFTKE